MKKIENVCIIDDDHIFVYGAKRLMQEISFCDNILVYDNGQEAIDGLQLLREQGKTFPSIIFLDLNMPILNGWDFLDDILNTSHHELMNTAVYIISSSVDPRDLVRIKDYSVVKNYILKPITAEDLELVLGEAV